MKDPDFSRLGLGVIPRRKLLLRLDQLLATSASPVHSDKFLEHAKHVRSNSLARLNVPSSPTSSPSQTPALKAVTPPKAAPTPIENTLLPHKEIVTSPPPQAHSSTPVSEVPPPVTDEPEKPTALEEPSEPVEAQSPAVAEPDEHALTAIVDDVHTPAPEDRLATPSKNDDSDSVQIAADSSLDAQLPESDIGESPNLPSAEESSDALKEAAESPDDSNPAFPPVDWRAATDGTAVVADDPWLAPYAQVLRDRYRLIVCHFHLTRFSTFQWWKNEIGRNEGSITDFACSYKNFGFHRVPGGIRYLDWAPGAHELFLVGDFSTSHPLFIEIRQLELDESPLSAN